MLSSLQLSPPSPLPPPLSTASPPPPLPLHCLPPHLTPSDFKCGEDDEVSQWNYDTVRQTVPAHTPPSALEATTGSAGSRGEDGAASESRVDSPQLNGRESVVESEAGEERRGEAQSKLRSYPNGIEPRLSPRASAAYSATPNGLGETSHSKGGKEEEEEVRREEEEEESEEKMEVVEKEMRPGSERDSNLSQFSVSTLEQNFGGVEDAEREGAAGSPDSNKMDMFERVADSDEEGAGSRLSEPDNTKVAEQRLNGPDKERALEDAPAVLKRPVSSSVQAVVHPVLERVSQPLYIYSSHGPRPSPLAHRADTHEEGGVWGFVVIIV